MSESDTVSRVPHFKPRPWLESRSVIRRKKTVGPSGLMLEMVASTREERITMIIDLIKQIRLGGVIPAEWELHNIANCNKIRDALGAGYDWRLKITD